MPRAFDVTCAKNSIKLESGKGEFAHTVSNRLKRPVRARAAVVPEGQTKREWLTVVEPTERDFAADGTQQFTVKVSTPPGTAPRSYSFKLLVSSVANPDEEFADGPSVSFEVTPPPTVPPPKFPWWILAVVGGVLVAGIVGAVLYFTRGPGLGDECDPTDKKCPEKMLCASRAAAADGGSGAAAATGGARRKSVCLLTMGGDCDSADKCVSNHCNEKHKCGPGLHELCDGTDQKCPEKMQCASIAATADGGAGWKSVCLLRTGVDCDSDDDCGSNHCNEKHKCGPGLHELCDGTDKKCPEKMECASRVVGLTDGGTAPATVCLFKEGGNCDSFKDCVTNRCDGNKCVEPVPHGACNNDPDCPSSKQRCTEHPTTGTKECLLNPGMPCTNPADCASFWCSVSRKTCTATDGSCQSNDDCNRNLKFLCHPNGGPGYCKIPDGEPCREGHDQECSGGACDNGRCHQMACASECPKGQTCSRGVCVMTRFEISDTLKIHDVERFRPR